MDSNWLRRISVQTSRADLDPAFHRIAAQGNTTGPVVRFLTDHGYGEALLAAVRALSGRASAQDLADRASDTALQVITEMIAGVEAGTLDPATIRSISAYIKGSVRRLVAGASRIEYPREVLRLGLPAVRLFVLVILRNMDADTAVRLVEQDFPQDRGSVATEYLPVVLAYRSYSMQPVSVSRQTMPEPVDPDILDSSQATWLTERGSDDPVDQLLAKMRREAVAGAVNELPEPEQSYARAWYLDARFATQREFGEAFGVSDAKYALRKTRERLAGLLSQLEP